MSDYEDFQRENLEAGQGYEGPPIPLGWSGPPTATLPVGVFPALEFAAYSQLPAVRALPTIPPENGGDPEIDEDEALYFPEVIDPYFRRSRTVYETRIPQGVYETNREPMSEEDWARAYDEYVVLNEPDPVTVTEAPEVLHGSIDWGNVVGTIVGGAADPFGAGRYAASLFNNPIPPTNPLTGTAVAHAPARIDPRTGRVVCKRRRRRRLLTDGDFNDLMRISTLPNKDIVKIALAKAVGR